MAVYVGSVALLQAAFEALTGQRSDLAIVASTLAISVLFQPVRQRVQRIVDRRFSRANVDVGLAVTAFARDLRGDATTVEGMIDSYRSGGAAVIAMLRAAASQGDTKTMHRVAHTLKGQSGTLGARRAEIVSRRLEERARRGELEETAPLIAQLEDELGRAHDALDDTRNDLRARLTA